MNEGEFKRRVDSIMKEFNGHIDFLTKHIQNLSEFTDEVVKEGLLGLLDEARKEFPEIPKNFSFEEIIYEQNYKALFEWRDQVEKWFLKWFGEDKK